MRIASSLSMECAVLLEHLGGTRRLAGGLCACSDALSLTRSLPGRRDGPQRRRRVPGRRAVDVALKARPGRSRWRSPWRRGSGPARQSGPVFGVGYASDEPRSSLSELTSIGDGCGCARAASWAMPRPLREPSAAGSRPVHGSGQPSGCIETDDPQKTCPSALSVTSIQRPKAACSCPVAEVLRQNWWKASIAAHSGPPVVFIRWRPPYWRHRPSIVLGPCAPRRRSRSVSAAPWNQRRGERALIGQSSAGAAWRVAVDDQIGP